MYIKDKTIYFINETRECSIHYMSIHWRDIIKVIDYLNKVYIQENELNNNFNHELIRIIDKEKVKYEMMTEHQMIFII